MSLHGFSTRFKRLALGLSVLALWVALVAPAAVLAQEGRSGQWGGLCTAGNSLPAPEDHAGDKGDGGHCDWCVFSSLGLPLAQAPLGLAEWSDPAPPALRQAAPLALATARPSIRGPPVMR